MLRAQGLGNEEGLQPSWPGLAPGSGKSRGLAQIVLTVGEEKRAHMLGGRTPMLRAAWMGRSHSKGTPGPGRGNGPHGLQL